MIVAIFYTIAGSVLNLISFLLSGIDLIIPDAFIEASNLILGYVLNFQSIFPVDTLLICLSTILTAWLAIYSIKIILWIIGFIPSIGNKKLPIK